MSPDRANAVANALVALTPPIEKPESQEERIAFEGQAKSYRDALVKPVPGEDVRRYQVQAQAAVSEAHFQEAAALYAKALDLAPWWPDGHFDRAIVLGETGGYRVAILEMKHYLQLIPDAKDGRVAQDKIYEWERKAGNGSGAN
jgi:regulator of sirC expression with transglutaminase-like and TPR domain